MNMRWTYILLVVRTVAFRILQPGDNFTTPDYFVAYDRGFTHRTYEATSSHRGPQINPGAERDHDGRQVCPNMIGPFAGGRYFCSSRAHGYCDRRTGVCHCNEGYEGIDCSQCRPSHFAHPNNLHASSSSSITSCYPKILCPSDCSGGGTCDYLTGLCSCMPHRTGIDCAAPLCSLFHHHCRTCNPLVCLQCDPGFFLFHHNGTSSCTPCTTIDPRCVDCNHNRICLSCADALLSSVLRSGFRQGDSLPPEDRHRELSITLPFGSQDSDAFADSETYRVVVTSPPELRDIAVDCDMGASLDWRRTCVPAIVSHRVCGHDGVFSFEYAAYKVREDYGRLRLRVVRSGGGAGAVVLRYSLRHVTTDASDVTPTSFYTSSQVLHFEKGVQSLSFEVTILDDLKPEQDEVFQVALEQPSAGSLGAQARANVTIVDNDASTVVAAYSKIFGSSATTIVVAGSCVSATVQLVLADGRNLSTGLGWPSLIAFVGPREFNADPLMSALARRAIVQDHNDGSFNVSLLLTETGEGLVHAYYAMPGAILGTYLGRPRRTQRDAVLNFTWDLPTAPVVWTGCVSPSSDGRVYISLVTSESARLIVNNAVLQDHWADRRSAGERGGSIVMRAGELYAVRVEFRAAADPSYVRLMWGASPGNMSIVPASSLYSLHKLESVLAFTVVPDVTSPSQTECFGDGLYGGISGHMLDFECCPADRWGNLRTKPTPLTPDVFIGEAQVIDSPNRSTGSAEELSLIFYPSSEGCFTGSYVPIMAGTYSLVVMIGNDSIGPPGYLLGSPFEVVVEPTKTCYQLSEIYDLPNTSKVVAGECYNFSVTAKDVWGNLRLTGGDDFQVRAIRTYFQDGDPASSFDVVQDGTVKDLRNGNFSLSVCLRLAGEYEVHALLEGSDVAGSPYIAQCVHNIAFASTSFASGKGLSYAVVGVPAFFTVTLRDSFSNIVRNQWDSPIMARLLPTEFSYVNYTNLENGSYSIMYIASKQGTVNLVITVAGKPIQGSPFTVLIAPGATSASYSYAQGVGLFSGTAGEMSTFTLISLDLASNRKFSTTDKFIFSAVLYSNGTIIANISGPLLPCVSNQPLCSGDISGQYYGSFIPYNAGSWEVNLFLLTDDGLVQISNAPFFPLIKPAGAYAPNTITTGRKYEATAGERSSLLLKLFDRFGNALVIGGNTLLVTFSPSSSPICTSSSASLTDFNNGSYSVSYVLDIAGDYSLRADLLASGLLASYSNSTDGSLYIQSGFIVPTISLFSGHVRPEFWSLEYSGLLVPTVAEIFTFTAYCDAGSSYRLFVSPGSDLNAATPIISIIDTNFGSGDFRFVTTEPHIVRVEYIHYSGDASLSLYWESTSTERATVPSSALFHWESAARTVLTVSPSELSSFYSTAFGPGLISAQAGLSMGFMIDARDRFGNILLEGGSQAQLFGVTNGAIIKAETVEDFGNASYLVQYTPSKAGQYRFYVSIGCCPVESDLGPSRVLEAISNQLISASPWLVTVYPADASHYLSFATVVPTATVGESIDIQIYFKDVFGNSASIANSSALLYEILHENRTVYNKGNIALKILSKSAVLTVNITESGVYYMKISLAVAHRNDTTIQEFIGSPYLMTRVQDKPLAINTKIRGLGLRECKVGERSMLELLLRDLYGNTVDQSVYYFTSSLTGVNLANDSYAEAPLCSHDYGGVYTCSYTGVHASAYELSILLLSNPGLLATYFIGFSDNSFPSFKLFEELVDSVRFRYSDIAKKAENNLLSRIRIIWEGFLVPPESGNYFFCLLGATESSIFLHHVPVFDSKANFSSGSQLHMNIGYRIRIIGEIVNAGHDTSFSLLWRREPSISLVWSPVAAAYIFSEAFHVAQSPYSIKCIS